MQSERFVHTQREYYRRADADHFAWQTAAPYFSDTEAALVGGVQARPGDRLLEIGCGEGGNLFHLRDRNLIRFGLDFSTAKAGFAQQATGAHTVAADAAHLPFADGSFDVVLIRDLLHHVPDRQQVLAEAHRVLKPNGRVTVVEPNARSPLVLLQAAAVAAERGLFRSTAARIRRELEGAGFRVLDFARQQPLPVARVLLHPTFGAPRLGDVNVVRRTLDGFDGLARRLVPRALWLYLIFHGERS